METAGAWRSSAEKDSTPVSDPGAAGYDVLATSAGGRAGSCAADAVLTTGRTGGTTPRPPVQRSSSRSSSRAQKKQ